MTANLQFARSQLIDQVDLRRASHRALVEGIHNLATLNETLWWAWAIYGSLPRWHYWPLRPARTSRGGLCVGCVWSHLRAEPGLAGVKSTMPA